MANKIVLKKSSVAAKVPLSADLEVGEIAVNLTDQKLYSKKTDGTVILVGSGVSGGGDVVGAASSTDNALARYDGTTGKLIQNSTVTIDDNGNANNLNAISFDTTPATLPTSEGSMYWDADKGAVAFVMQGGDVVQEIGESQYLYIQASANITKGQVVMFTGAIGGSGIPTGAPATGVTDGTYIMGIAAEGITSGTSGFVQTFGILKPINTTGFATGVVLWYDPTVTGGFTSTKPTAPNIKVQLAAVTAGNSSGGAILIRISAGSELGGTDSNVNITSPASGNTLIYDATAGVWENANLTAGTGISVTNGAGSITVANTGVTSVGGTGTVNGITLTGTVTTTGNLTLGGTLSGIANAALTNSSVTVNGTSIALGASGTITANNPNALTINNGGAGGASGTTYNGSSAITISYNTVGAPSTTGTNASGTWGISITGNAATITSQANSATITASTTAGSANTIVRRDGNGYIFNNYFNSTDNSVASGVTAVMVKQGDSYLRSGTAASIATFISGQSMNIAGSATIATRLNSSNSIDRTGSSGNANTDFNNTPAGTGRYQGDDANLANSPGNTWWIYENKRHSNSSNSWGTQVAWGWEDNANRLATRNVQAGSFSAWVYYLNSGNYSSYAIPISGGINMGGSYGLNDQRLYLRTNGDTNHYLWNANDDWEELVAYFGTGFRVQASNGQTLKTYATGGNVSFVQERQRYAAPSGTFPFVIGESGSMPVDRGIILQASSGSSIPLYFTVNNGGTVSGSVIASGGSTAYNTSSDYRMKENVRDLSVDVAINKIMNIRPRIFDWKEEFGGKKNSVGYIAHELQEYAPECVDGEKDRMHSDGQIFPQGVDSSWLIPSISAMLQEHQKIIEQLKVEIAVLKGV